MTTLYLDLCPDYIPFIVQCTKADGDKSNPTVDNLIVYEEAGADGTFDATTIASSPFDPVQVNGKTGLWGIMVDKSELTSGCFYLALWEMTVDGKTTAKIEKYFACNSTDIKADVSALAIEANVEGHVTNSLDAYDPPTRTEATADKDEILVEISTSSLPDFNVSGD